MSDIFNVILKRRSIRKFTKKIPSDALIKKILEAGRWAPSGLNNQPWRFMVIKKDNVLKTLSSFTRYGYIIKNAPVAIAVCMDLADSYNREKDLMSIGACIENMLLEAASIKLGTCWLGEILNRKEEVCSFLSLPEDYELMAVIALGYPSKKRHRGERKSLSALMKGR